MFLDECFFLMFQKKWFLVEKLICTDILHNWGGNCPKDHGESKNKVGHIPPVGFQLWIWICMWLQS